ncbi:MAG: hypothetical protein ACOY93_09905 [Bacillota bacterium]
MKTTASWLLVLVLLLGGCAGGTPQPKPGPAPNDGAAPTAPKHGISRAEAEALVTAYLQDLVEGQRSRAQQRYVAQTKVEPALGGVAWTQYALLQATEVEEGWLIQAREYLSSAAEPRSRVTTGYYLVVREGERLALDLPQKRWPAEKAAPYRPAAAELSPAAQEPLRRLALVTEGQTRTVQPGLPNAFRPHGAAPDVEFGVGQNGWGALALSPDGQRIAFVTRGTHAFLGVADLAGKVTGLDLWFEGGAGELAWSHDGQHLAATVLRPSGILSLQVWNLATGQPIRVTGLPAEADVTRPQWRGSSLHVQAGKAPFTVNLSTGQATPAR